MSYTSAATRKKHYWKNVEKIRAQQRARYRSRAEHFKAKQREYNSREGNLRRAALRQYGLTLENYEDMLVAQGGICAVCCEGETAVRKGQQLPLVVDHDHTTGVVRALLCSKYNAAIGMLRDRPELARAAASYLEKYL